MPYLIDGNNLLGGDRQSDAARRTLVTRLSSFARARRTRVTCVFDGSDPGNFGRHLGSVSVVFSDHRTADDVIADRARHGQGWNVVTSDRGLIARVQRREVKIVSPAAFVRELEISIAAEPESGGEWEAFFADDKNRTKF
jgi:predicted RNA-binding protein with PIN domain